jgi:hypothetical protein
MVKQGQRQKQRHDSRLAELQSRRFFTVVSDRRLEVEDLASAVVAKRSLLGSLLAPVLLRREP